ncbi:putative splicing factor 3B subunit 5 [Smittium culicis]|uniref:Putative splicing factor 3B subunit 5 n=1 Tax=Smittium culicis TaxID=133412 RepID=A0A1R1XFR1_9FUNG|nr:putative splicing factor 3B subunit 5 [Smittium culicis]
MFEKYNFTTFYSEWLTNQHRDTLAYIAGDSALTSYVALVEGESLSRVRFNSIEKMMCPCGPPPEELTKS